MWVYPSCRIEHVTRVPSRRTLYHGSVDGPERRIGQIWGFAVIGRSLGTLFHEARDRSLLGSELAPCGVPAPVHARRGGHSERKITRERIKRDLGI
jgi:hypothetical protein